MAVNLNSPTNAGDTWINVCDRGLCKNGPSWRLIIQSPEYSFSSESSIFLHFRLPYWISKFRVKIHNQRPREPPSYNFHPNLLNFLIFVRHIEFSNFEFRFVIRDLKDHPQSTNFHPNQVNFFKFFVRHGISAILNFQICTPNSYSKTQKTPGYPFLWKFFEPIA